MRFSAIVLESVRSWDSAKLASALDERARVLDAMNDNWYIEVGLICCLVEDRWEEFRLPYPHFSAWLEAAMPRSQSSAREAKTTYRNCHLTEAEMREIPRGKLKKMAECSPAVQRDPGVREKAKDKQVTERAFVDYVNLSFPDQHLEARGPFHLTPDDGQRAIYEDAMSKALKLERLADPTAAPTKEELFELICRAYIEQYSETEESSNVGVAIQ